MAIASRASVTVSIAADISGIAKRILGVNCVAVETSEGITSEAAGNRQTSSKVRPMGPNRESGSAVVPVGSDEPAGTSFGGVMR